MLKLKLQYFSHMMRRANPLEKIEGRRRLDTIEDEMVGWQY